MQFPVIWAWQAAVDLEDGTLEGGGGIWMAGRSDVKRDSLWFDGGGPWLQRKRLGGDDAGTFEYCDVGSPARIARRGKADGLDRGCMGGSAESLGMRVVLGVDPESFVGGKWCRGEIGAMSGGIACPQHDDWPRARWPGCAVGCAEKEQLVKAELRQGRVPMFGQI